MQGAPICYPQLAKNMYGSTRRTGNSFGKLPHPEPSMETRLIVAYALIAIMVALAVFGGIKLSQQKSRRQRRDRGDGAHMQMDKDTKG